MFEDTEAVIKMIIKGRCPTVRHRPKSHRVAVDWLFDRTNFDPRAQIRYVDTKNQLDMLTKGSSTRFDWNQLLPLLNIMNPLVSSRHFSQTESKVMSKRGLDCVPEHRSPMSKPKSMNLVMAKPRPVNPTPQTALSTRTTQRKS